MEPLCSGHRVVIGGQMAHRGRPARWDQGRCVRRRWLRPIRPCHAWSDQPVMAPRRDRRRPMGPRPGRRPPRDPPDQQCCTPLHRPWPEWAGKSSTAGSRLSAWVSQQQCAWAGSLCWEGLLIDWHRVPRHPRWPGLNEARGGGAVVRCAIDACRPGSVGPRTPRRHFGRPG